MIEVGAITAQLRQFQRRRAAPVIENVPERSQEGRFSRTGQTD
jgi:hypothetical protein